MDLCAATQRRPSKFTHIVLAPVGGITVVTGRAGVLTMVVRPALPTGSGDASPDVGTARATPDASASVEARSYARAKVGGASAWGTGDAFVRSIPMSVGSEGVRLPVVPARSPVRRRSYGC